MGAVTAARRGTATAPEAWRLRELGYLAVLSRVGDANRIKRWVESASLARPSAG